MRKTKFWLIQILMVAILGLILGSPALADKPAKAGAKSEKVHHGYDMRTQHANMYSGKAEWKQATYPGDTGDTVDTGDTDPVDPAEDCVAAGRVWHEGVCY